MKDYFLSASVRDYCKALQSRPKCPNLTYKAGKNALEYTQAEADVIFQDWPEAWRQQPENTLPGSLHNVSFVVFWGGCTDRASH